MVAKDSQTLSLLEVGQTIKQRFLEQSSSWDQAQILHSLELLNKADINYKTSKNQRLLVEFTLMQLCNTSEPSTKKKTVVRQEAEQANVENQKWLLASPPKPKKHHTQSPKQKKPIAIP